MDFHLQQCFFIRHDDLVGHFVNSIFANILPLSCRALFPSVLVRVGNNTTSMVIENLKYAKGQGVATMENASLPNTGNTPGRWNFST